MYKIVYYKDKNGKSEVEEYILKLRAKGDKDSRIKAAKIMAYITRLSKYGTNIGEPYIKHLHNNIWELRPIRDRILFSYWDNNTFVILSYFVKKTQKTPKKEIEKAERYLIDFLKRSDDIEKQTLYNLGGIYRKT